MFAIFSLQLQRENSGLKSSQVKLVHALTELMNFLVCNRIHNDHLFAELEDSEFDSLVSVFPSELQEKLKSKATESYKQSADVARKALLDAYHVVRIVFEEEGHGEEPGGEQVDRKPAAVVSVPDARGFRGERAIQQSPSSEISDVTPQVANQGDMTKVLQALSQRIMQLENRLGGPPGVLNETGGTDGQGDAVIDVDGEVNDGGDSDNDGVDAITQSNSWLANMFGK